MEPEELVIFRSPLQVQLQSVKVRGGPPKASVNKANSVQGERGIGRVCYLPFASSGSASKRLMSEVVPLNVSANTGNCVHRLVQDVEILVGSVCLLRFSFIKALASEVVPLRYRPIQRTV